MARSSSEPSRPLLARTPNRSARCNAPRLHRQGVSHIAYELARTLVEAEDHRSQGVVGFFVEVQNLFHPPHESRALPRRDHPLTFEVRLELVFLSVRLTVS